MDIKKVDVDGTMISYREAGPEGYVGAPILLVHGFLVHSGCWGKVMDRLSGKYRVLAPDLPGCGQSDYLPGKAGSFVHFATFLNRFLEVLEVESAMYFGHSMGGCIGIIACSMFPKRFTRAIFSDPTAYPFKAPFKGRLPKIPILGGIIFKKLYGWGMFQEYFKNDVFHDGSKVDMQLVRSYYESFDTPERRAYNHAILPAVTDGADVEPHVSRVEQPTLVIWGANDTLVPLWIGHKLEKELADTRLEIIPDAGHEPHSENFEPTMKVVEEFLG